MLLSTVSIDFDSRTDSLVFLLGEKISFSGLFSEALRLRNIR